MGWRNGVDSLFGLSPYRHWYNGMLYRDNWEQTAKKIILSVFFGSLSLAGCFLGSLAFTTATSIGSTVTLLSFAVIQWITKPRIWKLSQQESLRHMLENGRRAIAWHRQHGDSFSVDPELFFAQEENSDQKPKKFKLHHVPGSSQGPRDEMEDEHFYAENKAYGTFLGVCDGHGGNETAQYSAARLRNEFFDELVANDENIYNTFHVLVNRIHRGAIRSRFHSGNTVTCLYVNKNGQPFIANAGDGDTKLYRKIGGVWQSIPFGRVVDWSDPEEAKRYAEIMRDPIIAVDYAKVKDGKNLRYSSANISRSIGDVDRCGPRGLPGIIHKVEVSTIPIRIQPGDRFISACDGLWDHLNEKEIDELHKTHKTMKTLVPALVEKAVFRMKEMSMEKGGKIGDNVTVVGLEASSPYLVTAPVKRVVKHMRHQSQDSVLH